MVEVNKKRLSKIARQKLSLRKSLWPKLDENRIWHYKNTDGWLTVPRSMPLLLRIMDNLSKGKPVSSAYLDLWCRTFNDSFVIVNKSREMAFYSGFTGERAERTWASRMRILDDLGFIDIQDGPNGPISYALIYNPYKVIRNHAEAGRVQVASYNALKQRMIEIRAHDLEDPSPAEDSSGPIRRRVRRAKKSAAGAAS